MSKLFLKIYDFLSAHKTFASCLLNLLIILFVFLSFQVNYEEDIAKFLPKNEKNEKYQAIYQQIASQKRIAIIFEAQHEDAADTLEMAMEYVGDAIRKNVKVDNLQVKVDEERIDTLIDFMYRHAPYFLTDADYARMDSLLAQPDFINKKITQDKQMLMTPMGSMMMHTMSYDPLGLLTPVMKRLQALGANDKFQTQDGYIFLDDGKHSLITFDSPYGNSETHQNALLSASVDSIIQCAEKAFPNIKASAIGAPVIAVGNANQIKKDALMSVSIAVIAILALLLWHYRRLSDLLLIGFSLLFGFLFALAGMSLCKDSVSIIVLGIGSVIIGIAVNYPLHFLDHIREEPDKRKALREMIPPLLIGNITTVAAFLCLIWLDAQAMRDLGLFGALMLIGTILFVLVFLPLYVKTSKSPTHAIMPQKTSLPSIPHLFPIVIIITCILGYFSTKTSFDSDLNNINYMTKQQKSYMNMLQNATKADEVYVVAEGKDLKEAVEKNDEIINSLSRMPSVKSIKGIGGMVSSEESQIQRLAKWKSFVDKHAEELQRELPQECASMGFTASAFQNFHDIVSMEYKPIAPTSFMPLISMTGSQYVLNDQGSVKIVNYVEGKKDDIVQKVPFSFDSKDIANQLVEVLNDSFNYIGFVCGFVVFFFLWLSFGSIELSLMSFLPLAVSWIWILGIMQLLGIQFNIVNVILATFIFGQGDDYTIFITEGLMYEYATGKKRLQSYKNSVMFSAVLMFIGIGCLIFAKHPALRSLAEVTIIGMGTVVLMAYYLPPLVFRWLTTKHGERREVPITLKRLAYSLYSLVYFLVAMFVFTVPYTWMLFHIGKVTEKRKLHFHKLLMHFAHYVIRRVPGVKYQEANLSGETFEKPAVIICNHQSHLDLMCLMQLTPKMVFLTNDWVWNNPLYGYIIHKAEFYPVSDGIEKNLPRLRDLYKRGYSICVFPEGTRSEDCSILRFHKGAFLLARELKTDVLPIFIHGVGHVLPKRDFMLREGSIYVEVNKRVSIPEGEDDNETDRLMTHKMHKFYKEHYQELCEKLETEEYWKPYKRYQKLYKGDFA